MTVTGVGRTTGQVAGRDGTIGPGAGTSADGARTGDVREGRWSDTWSDRRRRDDRSDGEGQGSRERQTTPAPPLSDAIAASALDPAARRDLLGLQKDVAEAVARHLVAAGTLVDEDPEAALAHARYARRRASRIAVVREAAGITAYHAGEWAEALAELRAARRMGGGPGHLAVMADIERAMGRPERAIELSRSPEARELERNAQIELAIVVAGARRDLDEIDAAVVALQVPELEASRRDPWSARLFYAYADNLLAAGRESDALQWFVHAADADTDGETDADVRIADLTGEPLADDGIEFGLDDETPGDAPAAEDSPADNAAAPTDHTAEDADTPSDEAAEVATGETADKAAGVATDERADKAAEVATDETADKAAGIATGEAADESAGVATDEAADKAAGVATGEAADKSAGPAADAATDTTAVKPADQAPRAAADDADPVAIPPAAVATDVATHDQAPQAADLTAADVADGAAGLPAAVTTDDTAGDLTGAEADGETDDTTDRLAGPAAAAAQDDAAESSGDQAEHATDDVADHTAGTAAEAATDDVTTEPNGHAAGAADDLAEQRTVSEVSDPAEPAVADAADSAPVSLSSAADHAVEERDDTEAGEPEDRPDPAAVTNGHVDAAEPGSTPSNGAARSDAAAVAARGEADPR